MIPKRLDGRRARTYAWIAGALGSLLYYGVATLSLPRRTPVGTEHRLIGLGATSPELLEAEEGGRWWVVVREEQPAASEDWLVASMQWVSARLGTGPGGRRPWTPVQPPWGTWALEGSRLRFTWRRPARWAGAGHLYALNTAEPPRRAPYAVPALLDLRTGRTLLGEAAMRWAVAHGYPQYEWEEPDTRLQELYLEAPLSPGLDELPDDGGSESKLGRAAGRSVVLRYGGGGPLLAQAGESGPSLLPLAEAAEPLALSRDGRTLFFQRRGALWRLDLRRPLSELLDSVTVPELPDPPGLW